MANAPSTAALAAQAPRPVRGPHLVHKGVLAGRPLCPRKLYRQPFHRQSRGTGRISDGTSAILPSIEGHVATGFNTIWIDRNDPFWAGFSVT
jgi:4-hydroxyproline epimerase